MVNRLLAFGLALLLTSGPTDTVRTPEYLSVSSQQVALQLEVLAPEPLPYQAVRVRASLRNISKQKLDSLRPIEHFFSLALKSPGEQAYRDIPDISRFHSPRPRMGCPIILKREVMSLAPNEQTSVCFLVGLEWRIQQDGESTEYEQVAVFPKPGVYWLRVRYLLGYQPNSHGIYLEQDVKIQVCEPKGAERAVFQQIAQDRRLDAALLCQSHAPASHMLLDLVTILDGEAPTSYTDYARFALARGYLQGGRNEVNFGSRTEAGLRQLDKLAAPDFPFRAAALALRRKNLLHLQHVKLADEAERGLHREYPDALECLPDYRLWVERRRQEELELQGVLVTGFDVLLKPEEWREFRKLPGKPLLPRTVEPPGKK